MNDKSYNLIHGDCLEVMKTLADNSVDSIVTDCPYELGFMGKKWDATGVSYNPEVWREALRLLKPGGHLLAFGGTRTYHRIAVAIEDAGFEIRDQIQWIYGSGFPKSLSVSKAIDKLNGVEREILGVSDSSRPNHQKGNAGMNRLLNNNNPHTDTFITAPATNEAKQWDGWGTALKPANEPICLARKPLEKGLTVAQNVLKWGTGCINVDGCRVPVKDSERKEYDSNMDCHNRYSDSHDEKVGGFDGGWKVKPEAINNVGARFPANVIHDGSDEVEAEFARFGERKSGARSAGEGYKKGRFEGESGAWGLKNTFASVGSTGTASRFFYCAKASKSDRNEGLEGFELKRGGSETFDPKTREGIGENRMPLNQNHHPCVKPFLLMSYLCRLITPPNGTILDMFCGSGSTGKAAIVENFKFIGIEQDSDYLKIAEARIEAALNKQPLFAKAA